VRKHRDEFRELGVQLFVVTQSKPQSVIAPVLDLPTLCDPERVAFRYFGLERGRWPMFFRPRAVVHYLRLMFSGWRPNWERGEDLLQLGGDFILSADLRIIYAYRSSDPTDRPRPIDMLSAIRHFEA